MIQSLISRLRCRLTGHTRGKRLKPDFGGVATFQCRRCSTTWTRKNRKLK